MGNSWDSHTLHRLVDDEVIDMEKCRTEWDDKGFDTDDIANVDLEIDDDIVEIDTHPRLPEKGRSAVPVHCTPSVSRYPVWERKVQLIGEARIAGSAFCGRGVRLIPREVVFTSPPTLTRTIIVCGFVVARLVPRQRKPRKVALPFQAEFIAWPVRDHDRVSAEFLCFSGSRTCPIVTTAIDGRIHRACELKVVFEALVRVYHQPPYCPSPW